MDMQLVIREKAAVSEHLVSRTAVRFNNDVRRNAAQVATETKAVPNVTAVTVQSGQLSYVAQSRL